MRTKYRHTYFETNFKDLKWITQREVGGEVQVISQRLQCRGLCVLQTLEYHISSHPAHLGTGQWGVETRVSAEQTAPSTKKADF